MDEEELLDYLKQNFYDSVSPYVYRKDFKKMGNIEVGILSNNRYIVRDASPGYAGEMIEYAEFNNAKEAIEYIELR